MKKDHQKNILSKFALFLEHQPMICITTNDMHHYDLYYQNALIVILHVGTNNRVNESSRIVLDKILNLKTFIQNSLPQSKVIISNVINRNDEASLKASLTVENLNNNLNSLKLDIVHNSTIGKECLGKKGLHLTKRGNGKLAINFIDKIKVYDG